MSEMQYIGARYVPKFYTNPDNNTTDWKLGVEYEALTIVTYNGDSYTSKKAVPNLVGNPADNPEYWIKTGDFNASLLALQNRVTRAEQDIDNLEAQAGNEELDTTAQTFSGAINELHSDAIKAAYCVTPEMFGAVGDGVTDDGTAIREMTTYANTHGVNVAFANKTYLYGYSEPCEVEVSIDFNGCTIILNNTSEESMAAFVVGVKSSDVTFTETMFSGVTQIAEASLFGKSVTIQSPVSLGRRDGSGDEKMYTQHIVIDKKGFISSSFWGIPVANGTYTCINARDMGETPLIFKHVHVKSMNDSVDSGNTFITVYRNNVTVEDVYVDYDAVTNTEYIPPVIEFIDVANGKISDIVGYNPYGESYAGYIISLSHCCNITVDRLVCTNKSGGSWGAIGTDCSYDIIYNECICNRLDAHALGTYVANDCTLTYANFAGGTGNIVFNHCTFNRHDNEKFFANRRDYMYILAGDVIFNDCYFKGYTVTDKLVEIYLDRPDAAVPISTVGYTALNIIMNNCYSYAGLLVSLDVRISDYADKMKFIFNNVDFFVQNLVNILQDSVVMNMFKLINCHSRNTNAVSMYGTNKFNYVEFNGCKFNSRFRERTSNTNCVISFINCIFADTVETLATKCVRLIDNISEKDLAPIVTAPTYSVKHGNVIVAGTNTHISDWNS